MVADKTEYPIKKNQGVIWGKSVKYILKHIDLLAQIADIVELHSTCTTVAFKHSNIHWRGTMSKIEWKLLLRESKFLIGLGDPLLGFLFAPFFKLMYLYLNYFLYEGPSAIDAIAAGAVYINPIYKRIVQYNAGHVFHSQHPYAEKIIGAPSVCNYKEDRF